MVTKNGTISSPVIALILAGLIVSAIFPALCPAQSSAKGGPNSSLEDLMTSARNLNKERLYDSAYSVAMQALELAEEKYGPDDTFIIKVLDILAYIQENRNEWLMILDCYKRALQIIEVNYGEDDSRAFKYHFNLGLKNRILYRLDSAKKYFERSFEIAEMYPTQLKLYIPQIYSQLGVMNLRQAKWDSAQYYLNLADSIYDEIGKPSEYHAFVQTNLGNIYLTQGDYDAAENAYQRSTQMRMEVFGPRYRHLGEPFNNLGYVCALRGRQVEAEMYYKLALFVRSSYFGRAHPDLGYSLNGLGDIYVSQGRYAEADSLFRWALENISVSYGSDHAMTAWCYRCLGNLAGCQGLYLRADSLYRKALEIDAERFGNDHPFLAEDYRLLALVNAALDKRDRILEYYQNCLRADYRFVEYVFPSASNDQKIVYISEYPLMDFSLFTLAVELQSEELKRAALEMALRGKAFVIDALAKEKQIAFESQDSSIQALVEQLRNVQSILSTMIIIGPSVLNQETYPDSIKTLVNLKNSLEKKLSRRCAILDEEIEALTVSVRDIIESLPEDGLLIEYLHYHSKKYEDVCKKTEDTSLGKYLAFAVDQAGNVDLVDLGEAAIIDSLIFLARNMLYNKSAGLDTLPLAMSAARLDSVTARLYDLIFAPLAHDLKANSEIFISPDGQLNLLPYEIMLCANGSYAVENYSMSYLSSGRDLIRFNGEKIKSNQVMLVADPDFNLKIGGNQKRMQTQNVATSAPAKTHSPHPLYNKCAGLTYPSLPYSSVEKEKIADILHQTGRFMIRSFTGAEAREEIFKTLDFSPVIIHIATHAFFGDAFNHFASVLYTNPLLHTGIVLAGANRLIEFYEHGDNSAEDGVLTAFEISGMNLSNTELAVLSACETGLGEVKNGEGVFGLRRAFQLAGVQAILMSMWQVPDRETSEFMISFYHNWLSGMSKKEAFRQSVREVIKVQRAETGCAHPFLWGAFILTGDPD
jgi:CHAT domain-containing protein/tetratricopeptide (TPR) repeat protein